MLLFASAAIAVISVLILTTIYVTRKEFRKMDEHPEHYPEQFSHDAPHEDQS